MKKFELVIACGARQITKDRMGQIRENQTVMKKQAHNFLEKFGAVLFKKTWKD